MTDVIEHLDERDDVAKTEYTRHHTEEGRITVELWHDTEGLQRIAERAITGVALSQKGMEKLAKQEAIAKRETNIDISAEIDSLYPDIVERLKEESEKNEDYEYRRNS